MKNLKNFCLYILLAALTSQHAYAAQIHPGGANGAIQANNGNAFAAASLTAGLGVGASPGVCGGLITGSSTISECIAPSAAHTGSYTLQNGDGSTIVTFNSSSAMTATIPQATSTGNFANGWCVNIVNTGTGLLTLSPTTSTLTGTPTLLGQNGWSSLCSNGSNYVGQGSGGAVATATGLASNFSVASNLLGLAPLSANQLLGSLTAVAPSGLSVPSCSGASNALTWTLGTGFGCNTISGGGATGTVTSVIIGTGLSSTQSPLTTTGTLSIALNQTKRDISASFDGGGSALTAGKVVYISNIPYSATITGVTMLADVSCSAVVDVWKVAYASAPPTVSNTITASDLPTLSSAQKFNDTTLTGWTTSINAGDTMAFKLNSASTCTYLNVTLQATAN
jgi:hypothetical protein